MIDAIVRAWTAGEGAAARFICADPIDKVLDGGQLIGSAQKHLTYGE